MYCIFCMLLEWGFTLVTEVRSFMGSLWVASRDVARGLSTRRRCRLCEVPVLLGRPCKDLHGDGCDTGSRWWNAGDRRCYRQGLCRVRRSVCALGCIVGVQWREVLRKFLRILLCTPLMMWLMCRTYLLCVIHDICCGLCVLCLA